MCSNVDKVQLERSWSNTDKDQLERYDQIQIKFN